MPGRGDAGGLTGPADGHEVDTEDRYNLGSAAALFGRDGRNLAGRGFGAGSELSLRIRVRIRRLLADP